MGGGGRGSCAQVAGPAAIIVRRCVTGANRPTGQMSNTHPLQIINVRLHFVFPPGNAGQGSFICLSICKYRRDVVYGGILDLWRRRGAWGRGESRKAMNEKPGFLARRGDNIHQLARHSRKVTCFKVAAAQPKQDEPGITPPTPVFFFFHWRYCRQAVPSFSESGSRMEASR